MEKQADKQKYLSYIDPVVTVIIPAYNEEKSIGDCIHSLRKQDMPLDIIVVDDGSRDQTVAICETIGVRVFCQGHKGPGTARNFGARNSKGNILVLVDADMVLEPDYVTKLITPIARGEVIATGHWDEQVLTWDNPWARCQTYDLGLADKQRQPLDALEEEGVYRAVRKDFFLDFGGHSEDRGRGEDASIFKRTKIMAKIIRNAGCHHRNLENAREVFIHSAWRGKNVAVESSERFRRTLTSIVYNNPVLRLAKGLIIGVKKKEPYMVIYELVYSIGFSFGAVYALITKKYQQ